MFDPIFTLLLAKKDLILEKKKCNKYILILFSSSYFEIVLISLTKVLIFYMYIL